MNKSYNNFCLNDKTQQVIEFVPENIIKEANVTKEIYLKLFPKVDSYVKYQELKISNIGLYSMTRPFVAEKICRIIKKLVKNDNNATITDAMGNMGGMTITLCKYFNKINTCEIVPEHCAILKNNIQVYGFTNKVNLVCGDYMDNMFNFGQDIIFFDPPWGGLDFDKTSSLSLYINNINIICIIKQLISYAKYILLLVPFNYNYNDLRKIDTCMRIINLGGKKRKILVVITGKNFNK